MATIEISCKNFKGSYAGLNGTNHHSVSRIAFFRAVVTVGMQRFGDFFGFGWRGLFHRFGMALSAFSFLEQNGGDLCISSQYCKLDMSEKGAASYWYGMAFAKLVSEIKLGIPWLGHVDRMKASGALMLAKGSAQRGDLVGKGTDGDWHVLEANGRSSGFGDELVWQAKIQASRVISINGLTPATTSACIASLSSKPISVLLDDPPAGNDENGEQWKINDEGFFREYYRGVVEYLKEAGPHRERDIGDAVFVTAPLYPFYREFFEASRQFPWQYWTMDLELGLLRDIYKEPESAREVITSLSQNISYDTNRDDDHDKGRVGKDGIAIFGQIPDWEEVK